MSNQLPEDKYQDNVSLAYSLKREGKLLDQFKPKNVFILQNNVRVFFGVVNVRGGFDSQKTEILVELDDSQYYTGYNARFNEYEEQNDMLCISAENKNNQPIEVYIQL